MVARELQAALHQAEAEMDRLRRLSERAVRQYDRSPDGSQEKQAAIERLSELAALRLVAEDQVDQACDAWLAYEDAKERQR